MDVNLISDDNPVQYNPGEKAARKTSFWTILTHKPGQKPSSGKYFFSDNFHA